MSRHNISDYSRLEEYYIRRLTDIVTSHGAKYVIWQDPVDKNVSVGKMHRFSNMIEPAYYI